MPLVPHAIGTNTNRAGAIQIDWDMHSSLLHGFTFTYTDGYKFNDDDLFWYHSKDNMIDHEAKSYMYKLIWNKGKQIRKVIKESELPRFDLTGVTLHATINKIKNGQPIISNIPLEVPKPTNGEAYLSLTSNQLGLAKGKYFGEVYMEHPTTVVYTNKATGVAHTYTYPPKTDHVCSFILKVW